MIYQAWVGDDGVPSGRDASLLVPWWSFGKTVLAAAALALVRDRALALDERIDGQPYTLRQLLQHRAGLPDYGSLPAYHAAVARREAAWPVAELLQRTQAERLRYVPGEAWAYSNIGYLHVRRLLEDATAGSLGDALNDLVFGPLAVADVQVVTELSPMAGAGTGVAGGYDPRWVYHGLLVGPLSSAASLLHRLVTGTLLPQSLLREMLQPLVVGGPIAGRPWTRPGYGLGMMVGVCDGRPVAGHTGGGPDSVIAVYRDTEAAGSRTVAAFSTGDDAASVERAALALLSREGRQAPQAGPVAT